jgi:hypothetical protein
VILVGYQKKKAEMNDNDFARRYSLEQQNYGRHHDRREPFLSVFHTPLGAQVIPFGMPPERPSGYISFT